MYALFKNGKQITWGYASLGEIPVQTEYYEVNGKPGQRLLWPRVPSLHNQDGYEVRICNYEDLNMRPWDKPHLLFLTLTNHPKHGEEIILIYQGKEVSRERYNLLLNKDTGDLHIYMRDATWGDCCQAQIQFRPQLRRKGKHHP